MLLLLIGIFFSNYVYADNPGELAIKMLPGIITQDSDGLIQVYSKSGGNIDKLVATSGDPSIVNIVSIVPDSSHTIYFVKIRTHNAGDTTVAFAAPGFSSKEFSVSVAKNTGLAYQLLIKTTPSTFETNGPTHGYFSVETVNTAGFPTIMTDDTPVTITISDTNIIHLKENQVMIKKGSYYAVGEFDVSQPGSVTISASSKLTPTASASVTVGQTSTTNTIQLYVFPQKINAFQASTTYAVVQLHDASGNPILAKEDIPVTVRVTNSSSTVSINTSGQSPYVQVNEMPVIKKGTYWAYVPIELTAATSSTFNVDISAKGYLVSSTVQFTSVSVPMVFADDSARLDILPILASGGRELVGIAHLEDDSGNVLVAKDNLNINVDSSDPSTISVENIQINHGSQSVPVFARVGTVVNPVTLNIVTGKPQTLTATPSLATTTSIALTADPLIGKILTNTVFPLSFYETNSDVLSSFDSDLNLKVGPTDSLQIEPVLVTKGSGVKVVNATILQNGVQSFYVTGSAYSQSFTMEGLSSAQKSIMMDFSDGMTANTLNAFSVELLDGQKFPVYADHDVSVKLVSSDPSIIDLPDVIIKKDTYYTIFNATVKKSGNAEIAVLSEKTPLSKFNISIISFKPDLSIQSPDFAAVNRPLEATLTAMYEQKPLQGLKVEWSANDSTIQNMDSTTDAQGNAVIKLSWANPGSTHITATVSGGSYENTVVTKDVLVNAPLGAGSLLGHSGNESQTQSAFTVMGVNPLLFAIPVVAGIGVFVFKKKELVQEFMEKIGLGDKLSEIKEKIMELRQK